MRGFTKSFMINNLVNNSLELDPNNNKIKDAYKEKPANKYYLEEKNYESDSVNYNICIYLGFRT